MAMASATAYAREAWERHAQRRWLGGAMQDSQTVSWPVRAGIGAIGGIALVLLKLIEANFYVEDMTSKVALAAYCTFLAYILLGMIVAVFMSDHDLPPLKIKRSAFVTGLLAPTILIAVMTQPPTIAKGSGDPLRRLQHIAEFVVADARAQERAPVKSSAPAAAQPASNDAQSSVQIIRKQDLEPRLADAFLLALGRDRPIKSYMYVVGFSEDYSKAVQAAKSINAATTKAAGFSLPPAKVIKFQGGERFFVTVGDPKSLEEAEQWKATAQDAALTAVLKQPPGYSKEAAKLLLDGQIVDGRQLLANEKAK